VQRAKIILRASAGENNKTISEALHLQEDTVGKWRKRWLCAELASGEGQLKRLRQLIETTLADAPRPGIAATFTAEQICQIIALACEPPPAHWSHWTRAALSEEAVKRGIVEQISCTTIGRFLKSGADKTASITLLAES
jgi:hypothetical protein